MATRSYTVYNPDTEEQYITAPDKATAFDKATRFLASRDLDTISIGQTVNGRPGFVWNISRG